MEAFPVCLPMLKQSLQSFHFPILVNHTQFCSGHNGEGGDGGGGTMGGDGAEGGDGGSHGGSGSDGGSGA